MFGIKTNRQLRREISSLKFKNECLVDYFFSQDRITTTGENKNTYRDPWSIILEQAIELAPKIRSAIEKNKKQKPCT